MEKLKTNSLTYLHKLKNTFEEKNGKIGETIEPEGLLFNQNEQNIELYVELISYALDRFETFDVKFTKDEKKYFLMM